MIVHLLCFELGAEVYAIDLRQVLEIAPLEDVVTLPSTPPFVRGLLQREVGSVPIVDLGVKFGLTVPAGALRTNVIVTETRVDGAPALLGLLTTDRSKVVELDESAVTEVPEMSSGIRLEFLRGVVSVDGLTAFLLDLERALSATEMEALQGLTVEHLRLLAEAGGAGDQRGRAPAPNADSSATEAAEEYVVFVVADVRLAAALGQLRELLPYGSVVPVPGAREWIRGVTNRRGQVTAVIDPAICLRLPSAPVTPHSRVLVFDVEVEGSATPVGIVIDDVLDVVSLGRRDIEPTPHIGSPIPLERLRGIARFGEGYVSVLDVASLLPIAAPATTPETPVSPV